MRSIRKYLGSPPGMHAIVTREGTWLLKPTPRFSAVDLGKGKRMLVKGGKLDRKYQITVPEDMHAVQ